MYKTLAPFLLLVMSATPAELQQQVTRYWDLLVQGNKAAALQLVTPETQDHLINRRDGKLRAWRLVGIEPVAPGRQLVTVEIERIFNLRGDFGWVSLEEEWLLQDGVWKAEVRQVSERDTLAPFQAAPAQPEFTGEVSVVPRQVKIHFLNSRQTGAVRIKNGLSEPVRLETIEYDKLKFEIVQPPEVIEAGGQQRLLLRHIGNEEAKDLESSVKVVLSASGQQTEIVIPILYNYVSKAARGLFGLTAEQAEKLKRGDKLTPVLPATGPEAPAKPPDAAKPPSG